MSRSQPLGRIARPDTAPTVQATLEEVQRQRKGLETQAKHVGDFRRAARLSGRHREGNQRGGGWRGSFRPAIFFFGTGNSPDFACPGFSQS